MSSSSRSSSAGGALAALGLLAPLAAGAAEYSFAPRLDLSAASHSNRDFASIGARQSEEYVAVVGATASIATPTSTTRIRPRVRFQDFSERSDVDELEAFVELDSEIRTKRGRGYVWSRLERQDAYTAELTDPRFNELNPDATRPPDSDRVIASGQTRDWFQVAPGYRHDLSQTLSLGLQARYEIVDYSSDAITRSTSYDSAGLAVDFGWRLSPRTEITLSPYATTYSARNIDSESDGSGVAVYVAYQWSERLEARAGVAYRQEESQVGGPTVPETDADGFGGDLSVAYKSPVSELRFSIGRHFVPNGGGGVVESDQFQAQYDWRLSERLSLLTAAIYYQERAFTNGGPGSDSDYLDGEIVLRWNVTQTWFVSGGYRYAERQDIAAIPAESNSTVFVGVGYRGLGRR